MAKVTVKNDNQTVEVPDGSLLAELDGKTSILFACKSGSCGSCKCKVLEGKENLEPPNDVEQSGLATFGTDPEDRLLCVAKIKKGSVKVEY
ncbi:2Fe-2S iron-sulfur cluster binding domain protein [Candidatus Bilamarchaeum dharawalense]|uniref:2Fe-2S iron-sulfur cluster binding domain protein n=1 Tax=Candidatus Bilamarchaeum dharawalense TaxID=2885759 RepID=A0A5E4LSK1_9ARCH|nr:2Fe-2S iron-sulfur cluster binding domain protein [Candidatus Bilamarchaeum dharawalense]